MPILGDNGQAITHTNLFHSTPPPVGPDGKVDVQAILAWARGLADQFRPPHPVASPPPATGPDRGLPGGVGPITGPQPIAGMIDAARARAFNGTASPTPPGVHPDLLANLQAMLHLPGLIPHPAGNPGDQPRPVSPPIVAPQNRGPDLLGNTGPIARPPTGPVDRPVGGSNPPSSPPSLGFGAPDQIQAPKPQRSFPPAPTTTPKMGGSGPLGSF